MTQSPSDRLDRIEAALDHQVSVNADLRTSVEILNNTANSLQASVSDLRVSVNDLRFGMESLLGTVQQHQQNFEVVAAELRAQRGDTAQIQESQRTTTATLDRVGAILEYLVGRQNGG
jgi:chromosome segregation ATPase